MAFKAVFIAHVPDAEPEKHRCVVETGMYKFIAVLVRNQKQAVEVCQRLVKEEGIHSIILCPGNTHKDVAEMAEAVGSGVSVSVARGDGQSMQAARVAMENAGWFSTGPKQ